jgi:nitrogenase molybdenum-iron protein alpha/beta subunit
VDVDLPIGLHGTAAWLSRVAEAAGRPERAAAAIDAALNRAVPRLDRVVPHLAGRRVVLGLLPEWLDGVAAMLRDDLGMDVAAEVRRSRFPAEGDPTAAERDDPARTFDPSVRTWNETLERESRGAGLDVVVGSAWERNVLQPSVAGLPFVEFGYPSLSRHELVPVPFLGFDGALTWAARLSNALREAAAAPRR